MTVSGTPYRKARYGGKLVFVYAVADASGRVGIKASDEYADAPDQMKADIERWKRDVQRQRKADQRTGPVPSSYWVPYFEGARGFYDYPCQGHMPDSTLGSGPDWSFHAL